MNEDSEKRGIEHEVEGDCFAPRPRVQVHGFVSVERVLGDKDEPQRKSHAGDEKDRDKFPGS